MDPAMFMQTQPGQALAQTLINGKQEILMVIGALALLVGLAALWGYVSATIDNRNDTR